MNTVIHQLQHVWQEKPELEHIVDLAPRQRCGLACMMMQLQYYGIPARAEDVLTLAQRYHAISPDYMWRHAGQVRTLAHYGLIAWRRNWHFQAQGLSPAEYFRVQEGYDESQLNAFRWQSASEDLLPTPEAQFLHSLQVSLLAGDPVIVSVRPHFSHNNQNHQVVVAGWDEARLTYQVYDPIQSVGPAQVHESYLLEYANLWAIFTQTAS